MNPHHTAHLDSLCQSMTKAIAIQKTHHQWLAELAERFRPFDHNIAQVFENLSATEIIHSDFLTECFRSLFGTDPAEINVHPCTLSYRNRFYNEDHFFVLSRQHACQLLSKIQRAILVTLHFFHEWYQQELRSHLSPLLWSLIKKKEDQYQSIHELLSQQTFAHVVNSSDNEYAY